MTPDELRQRAEEAKGLLGKGGTTRIGSTSAPAKSSGTGDEDWQFTDFDGARLQADEKRATAKRAIVNRQSLPDLAAQDSPPAPSDVILYRLLEGPADICNQQQIFDQVDRAYKTRLADLTIQAFSAQLFPGKDGALRPPSNDTERSAAIDQLTGTDARLISLAQNREAALRELIRARNLFEGAKAAAQFLSAQR